MKQNPFNMEIKGEQDWKKFQVFLYTNETKYSLKGHHAREVMKILVLNEKLAVVNFEDYGEIDLNDVVRFEFHFDSKG